VSKTLTRRIGESNSARTMTRRLTLLATLLALSLASASAFSCDDDDASGKVCVECTGDLEGHRVRPLTSTNPVA